MRNEACDRLHGPIAALAAGRFDELAPAVADEACAHLDECASCAAIVGESRAQPAADAADVRLPTSVEWNRVWERVDGAQATAPSARRAQVRLRPVLRWSMTGIAAAILLAAGVLLMLPTPQSLALAHESEVSIESLEVYGDGTPMVVCVNQNDGEEVPVIWVVEESDQ